MTMRLYIGESPSEEPCEQVGPNYDAERCKRECRAFISQIRRTMGKEPAGAKLIVTTNRHDSGTYHKVEVEYDPNDGAATDYALNVESACIENWDDIARKGLGL